MNATKAATAYRLKCILSACVCRQVDEDASFAWYVCILLVEKWHYKTRSWEFNGDKNSAHFLLASSNGTSMPSAAGSNLEHPWQIPERNKVWVFHGARFNASDQKCDQTGEKELLEADVPWSFVYIYMTEKKCACVFCHSKSVQKLSP